MFSKLSTDEQNIILQHALKHGINSSLLLPTYEQEISKFLRIVSLDEVLEIIPVLCLQSPENVIYRIVKQVLDNGNQSEILIQSLKSVPQVCLFQKSDGNTILIDIIMPYFQKELFPNEYDNLVILIKSIMKIHSQIRVFSFDNFLEKCILPNIKLSVQTSCKLCLDCLTVSFEILKGKNSLQFKSKNAALLIALLGQIINSSIISRNGKYKERALNIINLLGEIQKEKAFIINEKEKIWLQNVFSSLKFEVSIYASSFLPKSIDVSSLSHLWILSCINGDSINNIYEKIHPENIDYLSLINCLIPLLSNFTTKEWLHTADLLEQYFIKNELKFCYNQLDEMWNNPSDDSKVYLTIKCLIECLKFLLCRDFPGLMHCINSFGSILKKRTGELRTITLNKIYLELCNLIHILGDDKLPLFETIFLDLIHKLNKSLNSDKSAKQVYEKVLLSTFHFFPISSKNLLKKLQTILK